MAKKQFKAESKRLLDLMINSIYTHKEIFLREIISNASDAIDKLCYISLTDASVSLSRSDFRIKITVDNENRSITVSDNGVGMTQEELEKNLGTIAHSGSSEFKKGMDSGADEDISIIGQFGVGFYSAFMVSDIVKVVSRAHGSETAFAWESSGADGYTITECERDTGTDIIMYLKADTEDENYSEFLEEWKLRSLIKKYSDYIRWPIVMDVEEQPASGDDMDNIGEADSGYVPQTSEQTINSMIPIWQRGKTDVSDEDCISFYKEQYYDFEAPSALIRIDAEGLVSYKSLLFVPSRAPGNYYTKEFEPGLALYCNGVMIMERCADILPACFSFVKGIVDSPDFSLNISREILQHDRQLRVISTNLEKKIKAELKRMMDEEPEKYAAFFKNFGLQIKFGVVSDFGAKSEVLSELLMFYSSLKDELISLEEYTAAMPEDQQYIYYACAGTKERASALPQNEILRERGYHILYLTEELDEFVVNALGTFKDKKFRNISADDLGLDSDAEEDKVTEKEEESRELLDFVKESLGDRVADVRLSKRLLKHPVCLSTDGEITLQMEKYFNSLPGDKSNPVKARRVLELNVSHSAFGSLEAAYRGDRDRAKILAEILYAQALLIADLPLDNPTEYSDLVCSLF